MKTKLQSSASSKQCSPSVGGEWHGNGRERIRGCVIRVPADVGEGLFNWIDQMNN